MCCQREEIGRPITFSLSPSIHPHAHTHGRACAREVYGDKRLWEADHIYYCDNVSNNSHTEKRYYVVERALEADSLRLCLVYCELSILVAPLGPTYMLAILRCVRTHDHDRPLLPRRGRYTRKVAVLHLPW